MSHRGYTITSGTPMCMAQYDKSCIICINTRNVLTLSRSLSAVYWRIQERRGSLSKEDVWTRPRSDGIPPPFRDRFVPCCSIGACSYYTENLARHLVHHLLDRLHSSFWNISSSSQAHLRPQLSRTATPPLLAMIHSFLLKTETLVSSTLLTSVGATNVGQEGVVTILHLSGSSLKLSACGAKVFSFSPSNDSLGDELVVYKETIYDGIDTHQWRHHRRVPESRRSQGVPHS